MVASVRLVQGDITKTAADAIVNAANSALRGGGGVDGAIHRAGGRAVMADLERRYGSSRTCPTGGAVIGAAYRTSLDLAAADGCRTVTMPSISTGVYGYPVERAAPVALETVRRWLDEHPGVIDEVTFVLFSRDTLDAFERARSAIDG